MLRLDVFFSRSLIELSNCRFIKLLSFINAFSDGRRKKENEYQRISLHKQKYAEQKKCEKKEVKTDCLKKNVGKSNKPKRKLLCVFGLERRERERVWRKYVECVESAVTRVYDGEILWRRRGGRLYVCECKTNDMENSYWKKGVCKAWRSFILSFFVYFFFPLFSRSFWSRLVVQFSLCVFSLCANAHTYTVGWFVCFLFSLHSKS